MYNKIFLEKLLYKFVVHIFTLLLAPFVSKLVNYSRHSESLNIRKNSEIDDIFLWNQGFDHFPTFFKDSLCLEKLTNLDVIGAKGSVKIWATNFYKSFFQKYFDVHEQSAVKNSFSTHLWSKVNSCFCEFLYVY